MWYLLLALLGFAFVSCEPWGAVEYGAPAVEYDENVEQTPSESVNSNERLE